MVHIYCANCGHRNQPDSNFCSSCGQVLARPTADPPTITFALEGTSTAEEIEVERSVAGEFGVLVATRGPNAGSEFALEHVITTLGRHPESDIFLDDVTVSRRHAEIERTTSGIVLRDIGSLNGTYLNQTLIDHDQPLANGDEVQVGRFRLVFIAGDGN